MIPTGKSTFLSLLNRLVKHADDFHPQGVLVLPLFLVTYYYVDPSACAVVTQA